MFIDYFNKMAYNAQKYVLTFKTTCMLKTITISSMGVGELNFQAIITGAQKIVTPTSSIAIIVLDTEDGRAAAKTAVDELTKRMSTLNCTVIEISVTSIENGEVKVYAEAIESCADAENIWFLLRPRDMPIVYVRTRELLNIPAPDSLLPIRVNEIVVFSTQEASVVKV